MSACAHLHVHSSYSFLQATATPHQLAQAAAHAGMPALALTDHARLTGAVEFYEECQIAGIKPLLGLELDVLSPQGLLTAPAVAPLVLLATDRTGWRSLCRLSSAIMTGTTVGLPFERFAGETAGLLCLTGGSDGLLDRLALAGDRDSAGRWLGLLADVFADRLVVELACSDRLGEPVAGRIAALALRAKAPMAAAHPIYYLAPEEAHLQRLLAAIRLNQPLAGLPEEACPPARSHFLTATEMEQRFAHFPAALAMTEEIASRCNLELPLGEQHFPAVQSAAGDTPDAALRRLAQEGFARLYPGAEAQVAARLEHELQAICAYGYASLFLIMQEIIAFTRQSGIPVASRGSASSSLVAHCLGITTPDPIGFNLYFERFLNPARRTPPDIDTDLCSRRRDEVIQFVYQHFGAERVAMVSTVNRFRRRSALREAAKAHGLPPEDVDRLVERLPYRSWGPPAPAGEEGKPPPAAYASLAEAFPGVQYQAVFQDAEAILGLPRHLSVHPGGVVITPGDLTDLVPVELASKGVLVTQFDREPVERLGLVKIDLLGIRGLTVLGDVSAALAAQQVEVYPGSRGRSPSELLDGIPNQDEETAACVREGRTIGCFQIESPGMRATLRVIQAGSVDDILAALALYRPGPLTGGLKDAFVRRHLRKEAVAQIHPALAPLLADTYGVILYQEQVLRIAHELAGLSLADADLLRRAMSHFNPGKQMETLKERFLTGAQQISGVPPATGERIWELMAAFAGYGFPKAHAASYAQVAWRAAWCKTHFPALFMAAVLANWGGYYPQSVYLNEARRLDLTVRPPHVNYASSEFSVRNLDGDPVLFMGLDQVRELTRRTQQRILHERPFHSLDDFLSRADPRPKEAESLVRAGCLDGMGSPPALLRRLKSGWRGGQLALFSIEGFAPAPGGEEVWSPAEIVAAQEQVLGVAVTYTRLELAAGRIAAARALTTVDAAARVGEKVRVAGMRQTWRRSRAGGSEAIYYMSLEDQEGSLDVVIPAGVYRTARNALKGSGPYLVEGLVAVDQDAGEPYIKAMGIQVL